MPSWKHIITIVASGLTIVVVLAFIGGFLLDWPRLHRAWSGRYEWAGWQVSMWLTLYSLLSSGALLALLSALSLLRRGLPYAWLFSVGCLVFLPAHWHLSYIGGFSPGFWVLYQMFASSILVALAMNAGLFRRDV